MKLIVKSFTSIYDLVSREGVAIVSGAIFIWALTYRYTVGPNNWLPILSAIMAFAIGGYFSMRLNKMEMERKYQDDLDRGILAQCDACPFNRRAGNGRRSTD